MLANKKTKKIMFIRKHLFMNCYFTTCVPIYLLMTLDTRIIFYTTKVLHIYIEQNTKYRKKKLMENVLL